MAGLEKKALHKQADTSFMRLKLESTIHRPALLHNRFRDETISHFVLPSEDWLLKLSGRALVMDTSNQYLSLGQVSSSITFQLVHHQVPCYFAIYESVECCCEGAKDFPLLWACMQKSVWSVPTFRYVNAIFKFPFQYAIHSFCVNGSHANG